MFGEPRREPGSPNTLSQLATAHQRLVPVDPSDGHPEGR